MACEVVKLTRFPAKGEPGLLVAEMKLIVGHGVEGDPSKGGGRQVSLLSGEARSWVESQSVSGLCFKRFRENILIDGLPDGLERGTSLSIGEAVLRVSAVKECFDECPLFSGGFPCRLSNSAVFAAVEKECIIKIGDGVEIAPAPEEGDEV